VVAVVVTHDPPAERLDRLVSALAAQTYPNLEILVVDTGSEDPSDRVHAVLPRARVERVGDTGYGAAANTVLDLVAGAAFYLFCHDDVAPDRGAVAALVEAAERWGADVVGPKLVAEDDDHRLLQFGVTVDKLGVALPFVGHRELDQGQHDGLRDVFAVPGACTLVRAGAFAEVGGFDEAIDFLGDDLSLCWRIRVAGGRVLVTSGARARHAEAFASRPEAADAARGARHRLRVLLTSYRASSLVTIVPQALALSVLQALGALVTGQAGRAKAVAGAWPWNLARLGSLRDARRAVASFRRARDRDVRRYMVRGLVGPRVRRLRAEGEGLLAGGRRGPGGRVAAVPERGHMDVDPAAWSPATAAVAAVLAGVLVFGGRHLVTRYVPVVGEMVPLGGDGLGAWATGARPAAFGGTGAWPPGLAGAAGLLRALVGGQEALARTLLTVGLIPLGVVGAHRLADRLGSKWAQVAGAVAYAAVPLPYDALAAGRWTALGAYAAAPWMLRRLAVASGLAPFGPAGAGGARPGRLVQQVVAAGAVTALAGLLVPQAPVLLLGMGAALALGTLAGLQLRGVVPLVATAVGGTAVAALLLLPTTLDVLGSRQAFEAWLGASGRVTGLSARDVAGFRTGDASLGPAALALAGAALVPLLVGRAWRLGWAVRAWTLALVGGAAAWAAQQGHLGAAVPDPGVLLAPAAAGLALAVSLGAAAVAADVRGRSWRFGLRRLVVAVGVVALVGSTASLGRAALAGWWGAPTTSYAALLRFVDAEAAEGSSRVLWAGDPALVPGGEGWDLGDGLSYTTSVGAVPTVADRWPATGDERAAGLREALDAALAGRTTRLGERLAPFGVAYVAVPATLAPGDDTPPAPATATLTGALATQLDLERVRVDPDLVLYRNAAFDAAAASRAAPAPADGPRPVVVAQVVLWLGAAAVALRLRFAPAGAAPPRARRPGPAGGPAPPGDAPAPPDRERQAVGAGL
jgi:GT2 family glycosyltransferase